MCDCALKILIFYAYIYTKKLNIGGAPVEYVIGAVIGLIVGAVIAFFVTKMTNAIKLKLKILTMQRTRLRKYSTKLK